ncbi:MAG TPA: molybdopterin molybdotransferase MoeA [Candidatus Angelobacter sp.]|nr:molybdopterin molybdotransferase MoeA [Candidatus Angelobacter sp.]
MPTASQSAGVVSFEQAQGIVREYCRRIPAPLAQEITLMNALGRVLAEPVRADRDFPPFPRSTRDGFAVRAADVVKVPAVLRVVGLIKAGGSFDRKLAAGEAVEIMTGAAVPAGADAVVMLEQTAPREGTAREASQVEVLKPAAAGENVVAAGSEAKAGQEILPRGTRLSPAQIAMAAGAGQARVKVFARPRIAILSTGDELVEVAETPGPMQIRNSNSYSLSAQVEAAGAEPMRLPIAPDEPRKLADLVHAGLSADMLLVSGGVSMGKFDLVEAVLKNMNAEFFFTGAQIQPGRPVVFGQVTLSSEGKGFSEARKPLDNMGTHPGQHPLKRFGGTIPFFGLPGNPISAMVCFDLFARAILDALSGSAPQRLPAARARLKKDIKTRTGLTRFLPAVLQGGIFDPEVEAVVWQGSGDLAASAQANCYVVVPADRDSIAAGEMVSVLMRS